MSRLLALAFVATLLASCKSYPKTDPIYGRQIIPSQRTGSLGGLVQGPPGPQYYEQPGTGQGNSVPAAPGTGGDLAPPGGSFDFKGSSSRTVVPDSGTSSGWNRPGTSSADFGSGAGVGGATGIPARTGPDDFIKRTAPDASGYGPSRYENPPSGSSAPSPSGDGGPAPPRPNGFPAAPASGADSWNSGTPYRSTGYDRATNGDRDPSGSDSQAGGAGQNFTAAPRASGRGEIVDIMDLPARGSLHPDDGSSIGGARPSGYAAFAAPSETAARVSTGGDPASAEDSGHYGYDPNYRWLKGHLEYSPTDRRWKLRYIPITGRTDQYGGSVILEDSPALQEMRRGDAVMVEGQIIGDSEPGGFAPLYRAARISRLR